ncbi:MAG: PA2169 family four-helix-bundle protein [Pricia sp.]
MEKNKLYKEIEEILEKNRDAEKGFRKAAENTDNHGLKVYFQDKAAKRKEFNTRLTSEVRLAYSDFDEDGSFSGTIHRAWMDVKALFSADDDEAMLEESIRGDKAAIEEYNDVLEESTLPIVLRNLLTEQKAAIQMDLNENKTLEDLA